MDKRSEIFISALTKLQLIQLEEFQKAYEEITIAGRNDFTDRHILKNLTRDWHLTSEEFNSLFEFCLKEKMLREEKINFKKWA